MRRALPMSSRTRPATAGRVEEPVFDWATLIANKDREIARLEAAYTANLERSKVEIVKSRAVLEDAHTVRLVATGETVRAKNILIATGAAPHLGAEIAGLEHVISSNEAFHLEELPKRILIQGGGYIARRVRRHLQRPRLGGDAGLPRRKHPARLRRRRARASARGNGAARHQDHHQADRRRGREGRPRTAVSSCPTASPSWSTASCSPPGAGRTSRASGWRRPASSSPRTAASRSTTSRRPRCRTSTRSATSPTASTSRRSRSARAMPSPTRSSAASRSRSITPTCRPRCFPSRRSA